MCRARLSRRLGLEGISGKTERVCGHQLPAGLQLASQLPEPIFTPSTKSDAGHDENIDWEECCRILGDEVAEKVGI